MKSRTLTNPVAKMRLYKAVFPSTDICDQTQLYFRLNDSNRHTVAVPLNAQKNGIVLQQGFVLSTDTYYNSFSYNCYTTHTNVNKLTAKVKLQGKATVVLMRIYTEQFPTVKQANRLEELVGDKSSNDLALIKMPIPITEVLCTQTIDSQQPQIVNLSADITQFDNTPSGLIYLQIIAHDYTTVYDIEYHGDNEAFCNDVNIGIVICTYKREQYVIDNARRIQDFLQSNDDCKDNIDLFVIDNGNTLSQQQLPNCTLIPNANLGGSGGFARGMMEVYNRRDKFTHFLLMDDDLRFEPEVLRKTLSLLRTEKQAGTLAIGASMLELDRAYYQHEAGVQWINHALYSPKRAFDMRMIDYVIANEQLCKLSHTAWWYCCMSVSNIEQYGLPMPYFIKWDDIEYGCRCKHNIIVVPNGIGVMHEAFDHKYSPHLQYYSTRNMLISTCLSPKLSMRQKYKQVLKVISYYLTQQCYLEVDLVFLATKHYLKGAKFLLSVDGEKLNKMLLQKRYNMLTKQQLTDMGYDVDDFYDAPHVSSIKSALTLNGYLLPTKDKYRVLPVSKQKIGAYYRAKSIIHYNQYTQQGFITKQKRYKLFSTGFKLIALFLKMLFTNGKAKRSYKKKQKQLTSYTNWQRLLGIISTNKPNNN